MSTFDPNRPLATYVSSDEEEDEDERSGDSMSLGLDSVPAAPRGAARGADGSRSPSLSFAAEAHATSAMHTDDGAQDEDVEEMFASYVPRAQAHAVAATGVTEQPQPQLRPAQRQPPLRAVMAAEPLQRTRPADHEDTTMDSNGAFAFGPQSKQRAGVRPAREPSDSAAVPAGAAPVGPAAGAIAATAAASTPSAHPLVASSFAPSLRKVSFRGQNLLPADVSLLLHSSFTTPAHIPASFRSYPVNAVQVELDLARNDLTDDLAILQPLHDLGVPVHTIRVEHNQLGSLRGVEWFGATLHTLVASHNALRSVELPAVFSSLIELDLSGNNLSSIEGCGLLACTQLRRLDLSGNLLDSLAALRGHPSLSSLDVRSNCFSHAPSLLAILASLDSLRSLDLMEGNGDVFAHADSSAQMILAALPQLERIEGQDVTMNAATRATTTPPTPTNQQPPTTAQQPQQQQQLPPVAASSKPATPRGRGRSASPAPVARTGSRPASPRNAVAATAAATAAAAAAPTAERRVPSRASPAPAARAPSPAPVARRPPSPYAPEQRHADHTLTATTARTPRSASPAPLDSPRSASPSRATHSPPPLPPADPLTVSLTRELLHLNQQLVVTTERLSASEEKRMELGRLAREQERKQERALGTSPTFAMQQPQQQQLQQQQQQQQQQQPLPSHPHSALEDMKSLLLGRAYRRKRTAATSQGGSSGGSSTGSITSAYDFLGNDTAAGASGATAGVAAVPLQSTPSPPASSRPPSSSSSSSLLPFGSLVDAIDSIVAKSRSSASPTHQPQPHPLSTHRDHALEPQQQYQPMHHDQHPPSPKSHLQLLSESDDFMPTQHTEPVQVQPSHHVPQQPQHQFAHHHQQQQFQQQQPPPSSHRPPTPSGGRGTSPSRTKLEEHKATALADALGMGGRGVRTPSEGGGAAMGVAAPSPSSRTSRSQVSAPPSLSPYTPHALPLPVSRNAAAVPAAASTSSSSSLPSSSSSAAVEDELRVEVAMLRAKGAALMERLHVSRAQCDAHQTALVSLSRAASLKSFASTAQHVLQSRARQALARRWALWRLHVSASRSLSSRRAQALAVVLARHQSAPQLRAQRRLLLREALGRWGGFVAAQRVASLKAAWLRDWEADLAAQSRAHATATIGTILRAQHTRIAHVELARALTHWNRTIRALQALEASRTQVASFAEEKNLLVAMVLQHQAALEAEQKLHAEQRLQAQLDQSHSAQRLTSLSKDLARAQAKVREVEAQQDSVMRACNARIERELARSRATVSLGEAVARAARGQVGQVLAKWRRTMPPPQPSPPTRDHAHAHAHALAHARLDPSSLAPSASAVLSSMAYMPEVPMASMHAGGALAAAPQPMYAATVHHNADAAPAPGNFLNLQEAFMQYQQQQQQQQAQQQPPPLLEQQQPPAHMPQRPAGAMISRLAPAPPPTNFSGRQHPLVQHPPQQQAPVAHPRLHDIHQLTGGPHPAAALNFSPVSTPPITSYAESGRGVGQGQGSGHLQGQGHVHARTDDVDAALRQAQETKRRLESETLDIARKIAEARARTSNYAQTQQYAHQMQQQAHQQQPQQQYGFPLQQQQQQQQHLQYAPPMQVNGAFPAPTPHQSHTLVSPRDAPRSSASPSRRNGTAGFYSSHAQRNKY